MEDSTRGGDLVSQARRCLLVEQLVESCAGKTLATELPHLLVKFVVSSKGEKVVQRKRNTGCWLKGGILKRRLGNLHRRLKEQAPCLSILERNPASSCDFPDPLTDHNCCLRDLMQTTPSKIQDVVHAAIHLSDFPSPAPTR